jgi:hypothetical protein
VISNEQSSGGSWTSSERAFLWAVEPCSARRAVNAGLLALSMLQADVRRRMVGAWMQSAGRIAPCFTGAEDSLIDFIAGTLPDPSPELALCRVEQLRLRAAHFAPRFEAPDAALLEPRRLIRQASHAGLVLFPAGCEAILSRLLSLRGLPVRGPVAAPLLIAPGLELLCRIASAIEHNLWNQLTSPTCLEDLLGGETTIGTVATMLRIGALEYA